MLPSDGIGRLPRPHVHDPVDYLSDDPDDLVTTAYPETGRFGGHTFSPQDWEGVSNRFVSP